MNSVVGEIVSEKNKQIIMINEWSNDIFFFRDVQLFNAFG